jgi:flagella basal body P-ring formation protein FlgA
MCLIAFCLCANGAIAAGNGASIQKSAKGQKVTEMKFRKLFHQYVCDRLGKDPDDVVVSRFRINANRPIPLGVVDFEMFQKSKGVPKGYVRLSVIVTVDGISRGEVSLSAWVDVFGPVVCAAHKIQRGETIGFEDIYLARKNVSRMPANTLTDRGMAIGLSAKNTISKNTCLKDYMLKRMPLLDKGEVVTILAEMAGLRVTTPGKALERGFAGDVIRVQNTMSKKRVYARIVDDSTVEVEF